MRPLVHSEGLFCPGVLCTKGPMSTRGLKREVLAQMELVPADPMCTLETGASPLLG